jgi:hypothetical protein
MWPFKKATIEELAAKVAEWEQAVKKAKWQAENITGPDAKDAGQWYDDATRELKYYRAKLDAAPNAAEAKAALAAARVVAAAAAKQRSARQNKTYTISGGYEQEAQGPLRF